MCYENGVLIPVETVKKINNWTPTDGAGKRKLYTNIPILMAEYPAENLTFHF